MSAEGFQIKITVWAFAIVCMQAANVGHKKLDNIFRAGKRHKILTIA